MSVLQPSAWSRVIEWVPTPVANRGRSYFEQGLVTKLLLLGEGEIIARVQGSRRYVTVVAMHPDGIESTCSCPYGVDCKHAVAALLHYEKILTEGKPVPNIDDETRDRWLAELEQEIESGEPEVSTADHKRIQEWLQGESKESLVRLIANLCETHADIKNLLLHKIAVQDKDHRKLLRTVHACMDSLKSEGDCYREDDADPHAITRLRDSLDALFAMGAYDALVDLGWSLLQVCNTVVEYEQESDSFQDLRPCFDVVINALPLSKRQPLEQLIWAVECHVQDGYGYCNRLTPDYLSEWAGVQDWSNLADALMAKLEYSEQGDPGSISRDSEYHRSRIFEWLVCALERSGRAHEVLSMYEAEAQRSEDHRPLVHYLIETKNWDQAKSVCIKVLQSNSGADYRDEWRKEQFHDRLTEIYQLTGQYELAAAMLADAFFSNPNVSRFTEAIRSVRSLGCVSQVRDALLNFLKTGERNTSAAGEQSLSWPLPMLEVPQRKQRSSPRVPNFQVLIDIFVEENDPDSVFEWFERYKASGGRSWNELNLSRIAECLKGTYPESSIAIWKQMVNGHIEQVTPSAYEAAEPYLHRIRSAFLALEKGAEWQHYYDQLIMQNRRRPRCMEVLRRVGNSNPKGGA